MKIRKNILLCLCAVSAFAVLCKWSHATTRYVAPGGGHQSPYTNWAMAANTLAAALTPAVNGDTIVVSNGLYQPSATTWLSKSVVITSVNGSVYTIFDGQGQAFTGLTVNPGPLTSSVYGITFTNFAGAAINLTAGASSVLTLVGCRFMNNRNARGGAIYMYSGRVQATNCVFRGNLGTESCLCRRRNQFLKQLSQQRFACELRVQR